MLRMPVFLCVLLLAGNAAACLPGFAWNSDYGLCTRIDPCPSVVVGGVSQPSPGRALAGGGYVCESQFCPAGTRPIPVIGFGFGCEQQPPQCLAGSFWSREHDRCETPIADALVCLAGYVWRPDLGRCDYPIDAVASRCSMTVDWAGDDVQVSITQTQACQSGADLAVARLQVKLLGGK